MIAGVSLLQYEWNALHHAKKSHSKPGVYNELLVYVSSLESKSYHRCEVLTFVNRPILPYPPGAAVAVSSRQMSSVIVSKRISDQDARP